MFKTTITCFFLLFVVSSNVTYAQSFAKKFTRQDTLRGSITPEREWWDLNFYHLAINVNPETKFISGTNTVRYKVLKPNQVMQIDLQPPMQLVKATQNDTELDIKHEGNAHFITLNSKQRKGDINSVVLEYKGHPKTAKNAPWDGGISWKKDKDDNHFIASSCQGLGASVWWPCKDHMYDEVDSMRISVRVPNKLIDVSNGRLEHIEQHNTTKTYHWFVKSPINNYGVNINIADYSMFSEIYKGKAGNLSLDYYVLRYNEDKAKVHFKQTPKILEAFEHWFGPYPFYDDGFKLVEAPYLGMEHQSSITYGNHFKNGYLGRDLSGTGWGLKFDFIIAHETAHEWFANSITNKDIADMWIHESFASYAESLYVEYYYGKQAGADYVIGTRKRIANKKPIIGHYNVNHEGAPDMYFKGANVLHTLRQLVNNDNTWHNTLLGINREFYHKTVTTQEIETFLSTATGIDLTAFFNQYLRDVRLPTLEYYIKNRTLHYKWSTTVANFNMPVQVKLDADAVWLKPNTDWQTLKLKTKNVKLVVDRNYYVAQKNIQVH
jgi:aminopeptidase N